MMMLFAGEGMEKSVLRQRARDLRKNSTDAERPLWYSLRASRLGFKFKRQGPIGEYIVDFVCLDAQRNSDSKEQDKNLKL
jgi:very-short-patch-repair endonuclease